MALESGPAEPKALAVIDWAAACVAVGACAVGLAAGLARLAVCAYGVTGEPGLARILEAAADAAVVAGLVGFALVVLRTALRWPVLRADWVAMRWAIIALTVAYSMDFAVVILRR